MLILTSKDNPNIKNAVKLTKSAKHRRQSGMFVAEGLRVCYDAMLSGAEIITFFSTEKAIEGHIEKFNELQNYANKTYVVSPELFELISDTQTPQGFLCVIKALDKIGQFDKIKIGGKFLALDNIQDPGNLGTILRSAEAFGVSGIIMSSDCCDVYSPKVVRGSMGAVFRLPFAVCTSIKEFLDNNPQLNSFAAVVDSDAKEINKVSFTQPCIAVIGNEGNGLKPETAASCKSRITIPMKGKAESLNASAAAAIIIWEMMK